VAALALLPILAVSGCSSKASPVAVIAPTASGSAGPCAKLTAALPAKLEGHGRRTTDPASARVTAWGSPAVVLRCGVAAVTTDAGDHVTVGGVGWLTPGQTGSTVVWTTVGLSPAVELSVPASVNDQENVLVDLAPALSASLSRVPAPASTAATPGAPVPTGSSGPAAATSSG
jgi:Protein of unknown function (DUF3515)